MKKLIPIEKCIKCPNCLVIKDMDYDMKRMSDNIMLCTALPPDAHSNYYNETPLQHKKITVTFNIVETDNQDIPDFCPLPNA